MQGRKPECYHVCTEGMEKKLFFRDRQDYISGMNSIPICAVRSGVHILAFCLMDNHVHLFSKANVLTARHSFPNTSEDAARH